MAEKKLTVLDRILKNSTVATSATIDKSKYFQEIDFIQTQVPAVNVLFSGLLDGGLTSGLSIFGAKSKHFKTAFLMLCIRAYFDKYDDAVCIFYDSEFGAPQSYFESFGIDITKVVHTPVRHIEEIKFDLVNQFEGLECGDHVIVIVDSLGNLASKKEIEDAIDQKSVADMTRAREAKGFVRTAIGYLKPLDIPMVAAGHVYNEMSLFPKEILSGGTGYYLLAQNVFFISRSQDKNKTTNEIEGWKFNVTVEKSRLVKEKSKIMVEVSYERGINPWSGLLDIALETGHVLNPKQGQYTKKDDETVYTQKKTNTRAFWESILQDETFKTAVKDMFTVASGSILQDLIGEEETDVVEDEPETAVADSFEDLKPKKKRAK
jgi:RecA/RadA recombinase